MRDLSALFLFTVLLLRAPSPAGRGTGIGNPGAVVKRRTRLRVGGGGPQGVRRCGCPSPRGGSRPNDGLVYHGNHDEKGPPATGRCRRVGMWKRHSPGLRCSRGERRAVRQVNFA